jgi:hypothetical protein
VFALVVTGIGLIYYFAPDADQDWVWITPGSLLASILWLLGSLGFRFYVVNFGNYEATYGAIAGVILLLLWFYLSALVIVLGAEVSAEIEHTSPWGSNRVKRFQGRERSSALRRRENFANATTWFGKSHVHNTPEPCGIGIALVTIAPQPGKCSRSPGISRLGDRLETLRARLYLLPSKQRDGSKHERNLDQRVGRRGTRQTRRGPAASRQWR